MRRVLAPLVALAFLAGCQGSKRKVIAVVPKATSHLFWLTVQAGSMAAGRELDVEVVWNGPPSETDYSRQIQIIDSLIARRVDGLAVAATDRTALVAPVERAVKAGIPVTVFDSGLDSESYLTFVATNNYEAGQMGARKLAELIGRKGKVAVVMHAPGSASTMDRERGFDEIMAKEFPAIQIVARQFGMSDRSKARAAAENMLAANPDLDGMFASSEPSSVGASLAIKARDLAGRIKLVTFDSSEGMVEDLKGGAIHAMLVQDPYRIGYEAVKTLVDHLAGRKPPKRMDLSAQVLTLADLNRPEVQKLLFPEVPK
ncbi:MAG: substrate-binding domain-containing protein [Bryobacteraceae bacterium]